MSVYTPNLSKILRHSALITLLLSSHSAFAMQIEDKEGGSKTPSIQPGVSSVESNKSDIEDLNVPPPSANPSVQAVDPEQQKLETELRIAQLRQQLAEQKMRTQAIEEEAARLTAQQYIAPSPVNPAELLLGSIFKGLKGGRSDERIGHNVSIELARGQESFNNLLNGKGWKSDHRLAADEKKRLAKTKSSFSSSTFKEPESPSLSVAGTPRTYRTTGENQRARTKHSAISLELPNKDLQGDAYELIVNHRTNPGKSTQVRVYDPKINDYTVLGTLPISSGFRDTVFDLSSWANKVRDESLTESLIATFLSFQGGKSDLHSFTIQSSGGKTLKKVVFGDTNSESQSGVHVYAPETDQDANDWSTIRQ